MITGAPLANAKPIAVPRKGAEQGVASTTASRPSKKLRRKPTARVPRSDRPAAETSNSKAPIRFMAKVTRTEATTATKTGS